MSGVAVVRYLLANYGALVAKVPQERIFAGSAPLDCPKPAISVKKITGIPKVFVRREGAMFISDRVQVTALVKMTEGAPQGGDYPDLDQIMGLIGRACDGDRRGTINGVAVDGVVQDIEGPDLEDQPIALLTRSIDFLVRYSF